MSTPDPSSMSQLSAEERKLLAYLLQEEGIEAPTQQAIPRRPQIDEAPPSFAQERFWFLDQLEPGNPAYTISTALRLLGQLDVAALEQSLNEIVRRHEALRTTFAAENGRPVQVIAPSLTLELPIIDLEALPETEREVEARRVAAEEAERPFNLAQGPLLRTTLLRLGREEHALLLTIQHIVSDGWSMDVFRRELSLLYQAFSAGEPSPLPDLPIQYADYAVWQREWLRGEVLEEQLGYWRKNLDGAPALLALPTDRPRPLIQTYRGSSRSRRLPEHLTEPLKVLSRREDTTLFMTLLAAFNVLLYRYSGEEDVVVGSPISGREHGETEGLIGLFLNTLILRTDLSGDPNFLELLRRERETVLGAFDHQFVPFGQLLAELQPERSLGYAPVFQVLFVLQDPTGTRLALPGLKLGRFDYRRDKSMLDLSLYMTETAKGLVATFQYNTDLFDAATIDRLARHFQTLLESIVADPQQAISHLPLMTESEQTQLLVDWNDTAVAYPQGETIQRLFEAQVARAPESVAVVLGEQKLTGAALNARANQLAHYLQGLGVGPGVVVAVCVERSLEMMVALLGVLKAGAAFLPLDPADPQSRQAFIVKDAQAPVLLTLSELQPTLPDHAAKIVCLDTDWGAIAEASDKNPSSQVGGEDTAYAIYTSGSTGLPKGVLGLHQGAVNRFAWMWKLYPFADGEVCCQKTALSFVDSIWEVFGPLLQGIPLVIIPDEVMRDPEQLIEALARHSVTRIVLVPSLLRALLDADGDLGRRLPKLRFWVSSGEPLPVELVQRLRDCMPKSTLLNLYGSSEVSADVTYYDTRPVQADWPSVPIGRPIANTQIYILDRHRLPVPIGVPGEIYVGGAGLARGYLNRPELEEEKFVPNPFQGASKERLYRTGDLARYLPDGNIECLGRIDHQVKIRGFRIELGEIETVLSEHTAVREAVALVREDVPGDKRLVAYVVPMEEPAPAPAELRDYLRGELPEYMVPSVYVMLDALPLTASGKVDRRALPAPDWTREQVEQVYVAPRTPVEEMLAGIWSQILGAERVGIHDDFFELGGHSLLATRVMARVRDDFHMGLSLRSLFEAPTVAGLASLIEIGQWSAQSASDQRQGAEEEFEEGQL
jgi:amino acid adenylation domain-containing protein